jgi:hypothetical protein
MQEETEILGGPRVAETGALKVRLRPLLGGLESAGLADAPASGSTSCFRWLLHCLHRNLPAG